MNDIAKHYGVSIDAVVYFMRKHEVKRRSARESALALFERKPFSYHVKENLSREEQILKAAAVMLYWAEGSKSAKYAAVDFANSDPDMIKIFVKFLRTICRVDENRIRIYLYCYANQNVNELKRYWSRITEIPIRQFTQPYVRQDYQENGRKMKHGMIHVRYADKKLLEQMKSWIHESVCDIL